MGWPSLPPSVKIIQYILVGLIVFSLLCTKVIYSVYIHLNFKISSKDI